MDNETETVTITKNLHDLIKKAVVHFLRQVITRPELAYLMLDTETLDLMEGVYAGIFGQQKEDVHRKIMAGVEKHSKGAQAKRNLMDAAPEMLEELENQRRKHCFAGGESRCEECIQKDFCSLLQVINKAKGINE